VCVVRRHGDVLDDIKKRRAVYLGTMKDKIRCVEEKPVYTGEEKVAPLIPAPQNKALQITLDLLLLLLGSLTVNKEKWLLQRLIQHCP
jgi:hypothetical protein